MSVEKLYAPQEWRPVNPLERAAFEHFKQKCLDTNTLPSVPEIEAFAREHKSVEAAK